MQGAQPSDNESKGEMIPILLAMNYVTWTVPDQAFEKGFTHCEMWGDCGQAKWTGIILGSFQLDDEDLSLGTSGLRRATGLCTALLVRGIRGSWELPKGQWTWSHFTQRQNFHWLQWCNFIHVQKTIQQWHSHCSYDADMENQHILKAISIVIAYGPCTESLFGSMRASHAEKAKKMCTICSWEGADACNS